MKMQIKNGYVYAKIPLEAKTFLKEEQFPGIKMLWKNLRHKRDAHNMEVDKILKDFAKKKSKGSGLNVQQLYRILEQEAHESGIFARM